VSGFVVEFVTTHIRRGARRFDVDALVVNLDVWLGNVERAVKRGAKAMRVGNEGREAREMQGHHEMEGVLRERCGRELRIDTGAEEPPSDAMCGH
jgi:hypothetical protein